MKTLKDITTEVESIFKANFNISGSLGKIFFTPLIYSIAGVLKLLYARIDFERRQTWVTTASTKELGGTLDDFAATKGVKRSMGTFAKLSVSFTGNIGGVVPIGTLLRNEDNVYKTTTLCTIGVDTETNIRALKVGTRYSLEVGDILTLQSVITDVDSEAEVVAIIEAANDEETLNTYRQRILQRFNTEPNGGSAGDYMLWVKDLPKVGVPEIHRIYVYTDPTNIGNLLIYVENTSTNNTPTLATAEQKAAIYSDNSDTAAAGDIIVKDGVIVRNPDTTLSDYERARMPITVPRVQIRDIAISPVTFTVNNLRYNDGDNVDTLKETITNNIKEYCYGIRPYIAGTDDPNNEKNTLEVSDVTTYVKTGLTGSQRFSSFVMKNASSEVVDSIVYSLGTVPIPTVNFE